MDPVLVDTFRALHILAAVLWFGGGLYQVLMIGPALMRAGPQAGGFVLALMKNGGIGRFFAIAGVVTILSGGMVYGDRVKIAVDGAFGTADGFYLITIGAIVAVLALGHGLATNMPTERKLVALCRSIQGAPTAEQAKQMGDLGAKLGKRGAMGVAMVGVAMLLMLAKNAFY